MIKTYKKGKFIYNYQQIIIKKLVIYWSMIRLKSNKIIVIMSTFLDGKDDHKSDHFFGAFLMSNIEYFLGLKSGQYYSVFWIQFWMSKDYNNQCL